MSTPTDPRFVMPEGHADYNLQWGVDSEVARQEFEAMLERRRRLLEEVGIRSQLTRTIQTDLGADEAAAAAIADSLRNRVNEQQFVAARNVDDAQYQRLLGAARFYGVTGAERLEPDELLRVIELRRGEMRATRDGTPLTEYDELQRTIGAVGIGVGEAISWIGRHIPFAGDALAGLGATQWAERELGYLSEGFRGDLVEDEIKGYQMGKSAGNMFGHVATAALTWRALQSVGQIGYLGRVGSRLSPIQRGAILGGSTEWLIGGGGDDPLDERAARVALGVGFGALAGTRSLVQAATISGSAGGVAGAYLAGREEGGLSAGQGFAIGATAGLGAVFGGAALFARVRRSFPVRSNPWDPRRAIAEPDAEDFVQRDINQQIQEAEWEFVDETLQQRLLGPGSGGGNPPPPPPSGGPPRPFTAPTPDAPAPTQIIGPERQLMSPAAAEATALRHELAAIREQRNMAQRMADTDALTGLGNFRALRRALPTAEADPNTAVVAFDGRKFKMVNDVYGHDEGDLALQHFAQAILQASEEFGIGARGFRQGGDEFTALVPKDQAEAFARRVEILSSYEPAPEMVRAAAIRLPNGQVFEGNFHGQAYETASIFTGRADLVPGYGMAPEPGIVEGFVTSRGRFIDRAEAGAIGGRRGQLREFREGSEPHAANFMDRAEGLTYSRSGNYGISTRLDSGIGPTLADADRMLMELKRGIPESRGLKILPKDEPSTDVIPLYPERIEQAERSDWLMGKIMEGSESFADEPMAAPPRDEDVAHFEERGLSYEDAVEEARNLTKQDVVMRDPELHTKVSQPRFGDPDVVASIVRNGESIRAAAIMTPEGLVVEGTMHVDAYENAGLGEIYDLDPQNIVEGFVTTSGRFVDRQEAWQIAAAQGQMTDRAASTTMVPDEGLHSLDLDDTNEVLAGEHYKDFRDWALMQINNEAQAAGIPSIAWTDDAMSSQLPRLIDEWLAGQGFTPHMKRVLDRVFNDLRVADFKALAPEDAKFADDIAAAVRSAELPGPVAPISIEDLAEAKGFVFEAAPGNGGLLRHTLSELEVPVDSDAAARAFLANYQVEPPDITPAVPGVELLADGAGGGPGGSSLPPTWRGGEPQQVSSLTRQARRIGRDLEDFIHEGIHIPPSGGGPGGGGGGRPPGGDDGSGFEPEDNPLLLKAGNIRTELGRQFAAIDPARKHKLWELMRTMDGFTGEFLMPHEHLTMKITAELQELGVDAISLWAQLRSIKDGIVRAHNEGVPWFQGWDEITSLFRSHLLYEGTAARIEEIPNWNDKLRAMQEAGYSEREMQAQAQIRPFFDRLWGEANLSGASVDYLFDYIPHVRRNLARNVVNPYKVSGMPPEFEFFAEYARHNAMQFREMDLRNLGTHWIRAWMFQKHIHADYSIAREAWQHPEIPDQLRTFVNGWLELVMKGHNAEQDILIQGTRNILNSVGIPVTDGEVYRLYGGTFANIYRAGLGWRPDVWFRDGIQPLMAAPIVGFDNVGSAYKAFFRGTTAERKAMWEWSLNAGIVERGQVQIPSAEVFERAAVESATTPPTRAQLAHLPAEEAERIIREGVPVFNPSMMARRRLARKTMGFLRDLTPRKWRGGIQGTGLDPLLPYTSLGQLNRLIAGEAGRRAASAALVRFRAGVTDLAGLTMESGMAHFPRAVRRQGEHLLAIGDDEGFIRMMAGKVADTQFRYGMREAPKGLRKTFGRMAAMFGTFTQQYAYHIWDGLRHSATPAARARFGLRHLAIMGSIGLAGKTLGWDLSKWMWHKSLAFAGGPLASQAAAALGTGMGVVRRAMGEEPTMEQEAATSTFFRNNTIRGGVGMVFPYAGGLRTLGLYEQTWRTAPSQLPEAVITGNAGLDRDLQDWLDSLQYPAGPVDAPGAGLQ